MLVTLNNRINVDGARAICGNQLHIHETLVSRFAISIYIQVRGKKGIALFVVLEVTQDALKLTTKCSLIGSSICTQILRRHTANRHPVKLSLNSNSFISLNLVEVSVRNISVAKNGATRGIIVEARCAIIQGFFDRDHCRAFAPHSLLVHTKNFTSVLVNLESLYSPRCADSNLLYTDTTIFVFRVFLRGAGITSTDLVDNLEPRKPIGQVGQGFRDMVVKAVVHVLNDRFEEVCFSFSNFTVISRDNINFDITKGLFHSIHDGADNRIVVTHLTILLDCLLTFEFLKKLVSTNVTRVGVLTIYTKFDLGCGFREFLHFTT